MGHTSARTSSSSSISLGSISRLATPRSRGKRSVTGPWSQLTPASDDQASHLETASLTRIPVLKVSVWEKGSTPSSRLGNRYVTSDRAPPPTPLNTSGSGSSRPLDTSAAKSMTSMRRRHTDSTCDASSRACPPTCSSPTGHRAARIASSASSQRLIANASPSSAPEARGPGGWWCWWPALRAWASELATAGTKMRHHTDCSERSYRWRSRTAIVTQRSVSVCSQSCACKSDPAASLSEEISKRSPTQLLHQKTSPPTSSPELATTPRIACTACRPKARPVTGPSALIVRARRRAGAWLRFIWRRRPVFPCRRAK
mmetsp:Transcript_14777/g.38329  ORF Transcript_14777/g.38329 Transcript_14777/m.38329 type:complete len:315 (+) Transcript_14777:557-1501(+)